MGKQKGENKPSSINCKFCKFKEASIIKREGNYMVDCVCCGAVYYLQEQHKDNLCVHKKKDPLLIDGQLPLIND